MGIGFAFLALLLGSGALLVVGYLGLTEKLPRNHFAGIRVGYTLKNDENWRAVHRAAGPYLILAAAAVFAASLAFTPFAFAGKIPSGLGAAVLLACAMIILAAALFSTLIGINKAKKTLGN